MRPLTTAVITGGHHTDMIAFHRLFRALPGIDAYIQHLADFAISRREVRAQYDVLVFYTHIKELFALEGKPPGQDDTLAAVIGSLGTTPQGLVLLHHSLLAFPALPAWDAITGLHDRTLHAYQHGARLPVHITDPAHPVTSGLEDWTATDETYQMADAVDDDNHVLLTTSHPDSMTTLAWTRQYRASRVVCLQMGDDARAWADESFRRLLAQAIAWSAA